MRLEIYFYLQIHLTFTVTTTVTDPRPPLYALKVRVMGIYVSTDPREDSWAMAVDASGSVLDHLQIPYGRDARAAKIKVRAIVKIALSIFDK